MESTGAIRLTAAYAMDAALGDLEEYPHPVRIIGKAALLIKEKARRPCATPGEEILAGAALVVGAVGGSYILSRLLLGLPGRAITETVLLYTCIAREGLARCSIDVAEALEDGDIVEARKLLKSLVGRDVDSLDRNDIARATVESVAENYVDGVLSPVLWAALGGAPAALAFKAISTLDSMFGHRDREYLYLGRFSARLDDLANYPAARISIPMVSLAAFLRGHHARIAFRVGLRDRMKHQSPNSAHAEAVFAGALGLRLGGPSWYRGARREFPRIGEGTGKVEPGHIRNAVGLLNTASLLGLLLALVLSGRGRK